MKNNQFCDLIEWLSYGDAWDPAWGKGRDRSP